MSTATRCESQIRRRRSSQMVVTRGFTANPILLSRFGLPRDILARIVAF